MKSARLLFVPIFVFSMLSSCSEMKLETPTEPVSEDPLSKLLQGAPDDLREAILKELPDVVRRLVHTIIKLNIHSFKAGR